MIVRREPVSDERLSAIRAYVQGLTTGVAASREAVDRLRGAVLDLVEELDRRSVAAFNDIPVRCPDGACGGVVHRLALRQSGAYWYLRFVCEEHHHWCVRAEEHSGAVVSRTRTERCPGLPFCPWAEYYLMDGEY